MLSPAGSLRVVAAAEPFDGCRSREIFDGLEKDLARQRLPYLFCFFRQGPRAVRRSV